MEWRGASCAARLRRLDEAAEIAVFDRPHVSFANCGLPYFVGDVITDERRLLVASPDLFRDRFNIRVRTRHEVTAIDRTRREIAVRDLSAETETREPYDALVLAPGAAPIRPPLPGIDLPGVFAVRTIPDSVRIRAWLDERRPTRALVGGGGFIGLAMAENLARRGLAITVLEKLSQVMPPLNAEMASPVAEHLRSKGVDLVLGDGLAGREPDGGGLIVRTEAGARLSAHLVILAIGVRPETGLARGAGLRLGPRGGILVDAHLDGDLPLADWNALDEYVVVDVREPDELGAGQVPGAVSMPLSVLRQRWRELPSDRPLAVCCQVGQRAYYALRFLRQHGFDARHLSGGYATSRARPTA